MSNLIDHAIRELKLSGVDEDIYGHMTSKAVLELMEVFAKQGHSGMSAALVTQLFNRLAQFKTLTPLTSSSDEWNDVSTASRPSYQNTRQSSSFSEDGGKTYYDLDEYTRFAKVFRSRLSGRLRRWLYTKHIGWIHPIHKAAEPTA